MDNLLYDQKINTEEVKYEEKDLSSPNTSNEKKESSNKKTRAKKNSATAKNASSTTGEMKNYTVTIPISYEECIRQMVFVDPTVLSGGASLSKLMEKLLSDYLLSKKELYEEEVKKTFKKNWFATIKGDLKNGDDN